MVFPACGEVPPKAGMGLSNRQRPLHARGLMALLGAEDRVGPGRDVADVELLRVAGGNELARGYAVVGAVADRQVMLRGAGVDEPEDQLAVLRVDARRVELELRHRSEERRVGKECRSR